MTPAPVNEATAVYSSARVHNTAAEPRTVKAYYAHPNATATSVQEAVVQPRSHHVFAPRTFQHAELGEQPYNVTRLELHPATTATTAAATTAPVIYETKHHHRHRKTHHKKHHGLFHKNKKTGAADKEVVVEEVTEDPVVVQIHETDGAYALSPYDEAAGNNGMVYNTRKTIVQ